MSRFVRPLLNLAILGGLALAVWPLGQSLYGRWSQHELAQQWQQEQGAASQLATHRNGRGRLTGHAGVKRGQTKGAKTSAPRARNSGDSPAMAVEVAAKQANVAPWPLTKLSIPDIGVETFVVQGWDEPALRRGPGHWEQSSPAGQGNCVVAGHRNIYGSPFYRLDELMPGATITLTSRTGTFKYVVNSVFPTPDFNRQILAPPAPGETPRLTLITCTVPHTNNRVVVQALLSAI